MALNVVVLRSGIADLSRPFPKDYVESAKRLADAYATYAATAQSVMGGSPVSLAAAKATLQASLAPVFATSRLAPQTAAQLAQAFTAFWLLPPVAFVGTPPGVVTVVPGS